VTAVVICAVFAVVTEPNRVVNAPDGFAEIDAVTEPIWAVPAAKAGSEPIVTLLPTVTEEMLMGTVPLMDAVTEPIWFVPAARLGSEFTVTVVDVSETGCVVCQNVPLTGTVPMIDAVTLPICAVPAPMVTVPPPIVTTPMRAVPADILDVI